MQWGSWMKFFLFVNIKLILVQMGMKQVDERRWYDDRLRYPIEHQGNKQTTGKAIQGTTYYCRFNLKQINTIDIGISLPILLTSFLIKILKPTSNTTLQ